MQWTSTKLANRIGEVLALDEAGVQRIHRVLRNIVVKGILPATPKEGDKRGTLLFDNEAAVTAVILMVIADFKVEIRGLREIARQLTQKSTCGTSLIDALIEAVLEGKSDVRVKVTLNWSSVSAKISMWTDVYVDGEPVQLSPSQDSRVQFALEAHRLAQIPLGEISVPTIPLLEKFIHVIPNMN